MKIGVLALQGDFSAHQKCLEHQNVPVLQVRESKDLDAIEGLVLPGGESSVMSRLLLRYGLFEPLQKKIQQGLPIFATCAGRFPSRAPKCGAGLMRGVLDDQSMGFGLFRDGVRYVDGNRSSGNG